MVGQTETYKARILANYNSLYLLLGLRVDGKIDIPLYDFLVDSKARFRDYYSDKVNISDNNLRLEASVAEVSKLSESCSFAYISLLDFDSYERIDYLLNLLLAYQDINSVTSFMGKEVKELIEYMTMIERSNGPMFKNTLSYMTIRNFLMLLVNKKFLHASVYATFLKEQIFLSEGLSPKVRFSDLYKGELGLSILKSRATYSAKIRRTLKKQVKDIVKKGNDEPSIIKEDSPTIVKKVIYGVNEDLEKVKLVGTVISISDSKKNKVSLPKMREYIDRMIEERVKYNNSSKYSEDRFEDSSPRLSRDDTVIQSPSPSEVFEREVDREY